MSLKLKPLIRESYLLLRKLHLLQNLKLKIFEPVRQSYGKKEEKNEKNTEQFSVFSFIKSDFSKRFRLFSDMPLAYDQPSESKQTDVQYPFPVNGQTLLPEAFHPES